MAIRANQLEFANGNSKSRILTKRNNMMQLHVFNSEALSTLLTPTIVGHPFLTLDTLQFLVLITDNGIILLPSFQPAGTDIEIDGADSQILAKIHSVTVLIDKCF